VSDVIAEEEVQAPAYALYSLGQIRWTTLLGGPLAATMMMSHNFRKLGLPARAKWTWSIGGGALAVIMALSIVAEQRLGKVGSLSLGLPLAIGAATIAKQTQGTALERHRNSGGLAPPFWKALLVLLGSVMLLTIGTAQLSALLSKTVRLDGGHQVSVEGYATPSDAIRTGTVLTEIGFLTPAHPVEFTLGRNKKSWVLEFTLAADAGRDEGLVSALEDLARTLRERAFDGAPVEVKLNNRFGFTTTTLGVDAEGGVSRH
jgi:hypothetical protein